MASILDVFARLLLDDSEFDPDRPVEAMRKAGKKMQDIGRKGLTRVTLPLAAFGALAVKTAVDFDSAMTGVRKTVDGTEEDFMRLADAARENARATGIAATEFLDVAAIAGQLGVATGDLEHFTDVMLGLGIATDISSEQAALSLAQFTNVMGTASDEIDELGSTIVALGNNMATQEGAIIEFAQRLSGAGRSVGLTEQQVLAFSATMSSLGINAELGGTNFSQAMLRMQKAVQSGVGAGNDELNAFAAVSGMTAEQFIQAFEEDAAGAMQAFIAGLSEIDNASVMLDEVGLRGARVQDVFLRMSNSTDTLTNALNISNQAWEENTALGTETERFYDSMAQQLKAAAEGFKQFAAPIGAIIVPMLVGFLAKLQPIADWFIDAPPFIQKGAVVLGVLAAAIPPLLIGLGFMTTAIGALTAVSLPWLLIIGAIIAVIALIVLAFVFWEDIVAWFKKQWEQSLAIIKAVWAAVSTAILNAWEAFKNGITQAMVKIILTVLRKWREMKEGLARIGDAILQGAKDLFWNSIPGILIKALPRLVKVGMDLMNGLWEGLKQVWARIADWVSEKASSIVDTFKDVLDIGSPSRVMALEVGMPIGQGIQVGIDKVPITLPRIAMPDVDPINSLGAAPLALAPTGGDTFWEVHITQQPGESSQGLLDRLMAMVDDRQQQQQRRSRFA